MKVPHGGSLKSLQPVIPVLFSYILSFVNIGIYWNNYHHMMHAIRHVSGNVLWANIYLLFWLSLIPFASGWMGENHFATIPVAIYRIVVCMCGIAYYILAQFLIKLHGKDSILELALGRDRKGVLSVLIYIAGILLSFIHPMLGVSLYTIVAVIWFIPDTRIEKRLNPD